MERLSHNGARIFALDLPKPVSANRMWRHDSNHHLSAEYKSWIKTADGHLLWSGQNRGRAPIEGWFIVTVYIREGPRLDPDNYIKPLLDWAQRAGIIKNDKNLRDLRLSYGPIDNDCRLVIEELA